MPLINRIKVHIFRSGLPGMASDFSSVGRAATVPLLKEARVRTRIPSARKFASSLADVRPSTLAFSRAEATHVEKLGFVCGGIMSVMDGRHRQ